MTRIDAVFTCPDCGLRETMRFDAGFLMDRAFEGLVFDVKRSQNADGFVVEPQAKNEKYLSDFNMPKHLAEARRMLLDEDAGLMFVLCGTCGEPVE